MKCPASSVWRRLAVVPMALLLLPWTNGCRHQAGEALQTTANTLCQMTPFLTGPAAGFLTNDCGFSARCGIRMENAGQPPLSLAGRLYVRGDQFRLETNPGQYQPGSPAELGLVWNASTQTGWAFCEALQGYAVCQNDPGFTNVNQEKVLGQSDQMDGHPVDHVEAVFLDRHGQKQIIQVARTLDPSRIPMEIRAVDTASNACTLKLTQIEGPVPAAGLYLPPVGFTPYPSEAALVAELETRQTGYYGSRGGGAPSHSSDDPLSSYSTGDLINDVNSLVGNDKQPQGKK